MLGIGGIGMSALARYFKESGTEVAGYDRNSSSLTDRLKDLGVECHFIDDPEWIPDNFKKRNTLVIYTPAIPSTNKEFVHLKENGYTLVKRSQVLGELAADKDLIAIGGTHGKTSTSAISAHMLTEGKKKCHAFVGGVMVNYETNFLSGGRSKLMVAEADEYDRSFLTLHPEIAVVTSTEADHLDIYQDQRSLVRAFNQFVQQIKPDGTLIYKHGIDLKLPDHVEALSYGFEKEADLCARKIRVEEGAFVYDVKGVVNIEGIRQPFPGRHNIENTLAAILIAHKLGISDRKIVQAIDSFRGVARRFEKVAEHEGSVYIDDYAHHPTEIKACIAAARELYPGRKVTGIFQPHLYSRTRDFSNEFAEALSSLDEAILIPIYPAREEPIPGVTSELILQKLQAPLQHSLSRDEAVGHVIKNRPEVLLTMGAGDIDQMVPVLASVYREDDEA